ncbi:MAG: methyltransferase domain-containing protein [Actinomycetota bacterium]|nr:methyltransferase domain-containing protein [Actinomycetota bacterium]
MYPRLLDLLRCPECLSTLEVEPLTVTADGTGEISEGLLHCGTHWYPIAGGVPRFLPGALEEHWSKLAPHMTASLERRVTGDTQATKHSISGDPRTRENFSLEWEHHELGDRTWGIDLDARVEYFFVSALRIPREELSGKLVLDAGCGNGSQSVAYTKLGLEVVAVDLSTGVELGHAFRHRYPEGRADRVHFVQADLQSPPFPPATFDIIHSAGVLHHTPDTERTFRRLAVTLKNDGTFYIWLYKHEPGVTPVVDSIRSVTTKMSPRTFAKVAEMAAPAFVGFCSAVNSLGIRAYPSMSRPEAALALMDIFGAPYAHAHSLPEVTRWYEEEGFKEVWGCNESRRGFGACGRRIP